MTIQLAFSEQQKEMVAIKIVSKYHVPDEFLRKFFYNEIRVVKFLRHPNIIDYYQSIESSHRFASHLAPSNIDNSRSKVVRDYAVC